VADVDAVRYPDIAGAGSLRSALQGVFDAAGHELTALVPTAPGWRYIGATVAADDRATDVVMGLHERVFTVQCWADGVLITSGNTDDLPAVADAVRRWLAGATVRELNAASRFTQVSAWAEACERGAAIEYTWARYGEHRQLSAFVSEALHEPRLRALFPFTSMGMLGFRRTVRTTPSVGPWVRPLADGRYQVLGPARRELGVADAAGSVRLVLDAL